MFIYLNKKIKIAIPNPVAVNALSWNREKGYICVGGEDGLLKVLKMDPMTSRDKNATASTLTMNQTLDGHQGSVQVVTWNEHYQKLTTSDTLGLIIVWIFYKGHWYEEMINNRGESVVQSMKWNTDGRMICIAYRDGYVIVGGFEGDRLWGANVGAQLEAVEWSPDGKRILFGTEGGEVHIYDASNPRSINFVDKLDLTDVLRGTSGIAKIIGIDWYSGAFGYVEENCPSLVICFENGRLQIMRDIYDQDPAMIESEMTVAQCCFNERGTVLALAGSQETDDGGSPESVVQFYTPFGDHLRTLKVPGTNINSLSWEGGGLRLSIAVDHFIYFANVRPDYQWSYFSNTVVYVSP